MKKISLLILFSGLIGQTFCQSKKVKSIYPEVGKPMPDFVLKDVQYFPKKQVTLKDFKGKWLVLDWWTEYCTYCIESFPQVDALQEEFKDKVQFMLIGHTGTMLMGSWSTGDKKVRAIYERSKKTLALTLPIAYDSLLYQKFNLGTTPYIVVIDPQGIVRGITIHLSSNNIRDLIAGKQVALPKAYRLDEPKPKPGLDNTIPLLTFNNGGSDTSFIYRSLLAKWTPEMGYNNITQLSKGRYELFHSPLENLMIYAFSGQFPPLQPPPSFFPMDRTDSIYGKWSNQVVLEVKDSSLFKYDYVDGRGLYCYSLITTGKKFTEEFVRENLQRDLKSCFGFDISVETRKLPYYRVVANEEAKQRLKSTSEKFSGEYTKGVGYVAKGITMRYLIYDLASYFQFYPPFIDETGITGKIDLSINALLTNLGDYRRALNEYGIDIVKAEKEMKVIVVRDAKKAE
jgi:thiol-disulfide isomerase/thioredoxin